MPSPQSALKVRVSYQSLAGPSETIVAHNMRRDTIGNHIFEIRRFVMLSSWSQTK